MSRSSASLAAAAPLKSRACSLNLARRRRAPTVSIFAPEGPDAAAPPDRFAAPEVPPVKILLVLGLFVLTAVAEIVGCYLPYLWLRKGGSAWLLLPAAIALALFVWLLTLHPAAAGRTYAAYGGVYVVVAILWLWIVDGIRPDRWDLMGGTIAILGMFVIMFAPKSP